MLQTGPAPAVVALWEINQQTEAILHLSLRLPLPRSLFVVGIWGLNHRWEYIHSLFPSQIKKKKPFSFNICPQKNKKLKMTYMELILIIKRKKLQKQEL